MKRSDKTMTFCQKDSLVPFFDSETQRPIQQFFFFFKFFFQIFLFRGMEAPFGWDLYFPEEEYSYEDPKIPLILAFSSFFREHGIPHLTQVSFEIYP